MSRQNNIINKPEPAPGTLGKLDLFGNRKKQNWRYFLPKTADKRVEQPA